MMLANFGETVEDYLHRAMASKLKQGELCDDTFSQAVVDKVNGGRSMTPGGLKVALDKGRLTSWRDQHGYPAKRFKAAAAAKPTAEEQQ